MEETSSGASPPAANPPSTSEPDPTAPPVDPLDVRTIEALEDAGADLSRPTHVIHYFHFVTGRGAREASQEVSRLGFKTRITSPRGGRDEWLLTGSRNMIVNIEIISLLGANFTMIAREHDGGYDGWEAQVQ